MHQEELGAHHIKGLALDEEVHRFIALQVILVIGNELLHDRSNHSWIVQAVFVLFQETVTQLLNAGRRHHFLGGLRRHTQLRVAGQVEHRITELHVLVDGQRGVSVFDDGRCNKAHRHVSCGDGVRIHHAIEQFLLKLTRVDATRLECHLGPERPNETGVVKEHVAVAGVYRILKHVLDVALSELHRIRESKQGHASRGVLNHGERVTLLRIDEEVSGRCLHNAVRERFLLPLVRDFLHQTEGGDDPSFALVFPSLHGFQEEFTTQHFS